MWVEQSLYNWSIRKQRRSSCQHLQARHSHVRLQLQCVQRLEGELSHLLKGHRSLRVYHRASSSSRKNRKQTPSSKGVSSGHGSFDRPRFHNRGGQAWARGFSTWSSLAGGAVQGLRGLQSLRVDSKLWFSWVCSFRWLAAVFGQIGNARSVDNTFPKGSLTFLNQINVGYWLVQGVPPSPQTTFGYAIVWKKQWIGYTIV